MTTDGGLRQLFRQHIPQADWQSVETWSTGQGVPDLNYCIDGHEGWIELKQTKAYAVTIRPEQIAWAERRARSGGRVLLAVRRKHGGGPRLGDPIDELWMFDHRAFRDISQGGLPNTWPVTRHLITKGGPARWDWAAIRALMKEKA